MKKLEKLIEKSEIHKEDREIVLETVTRYFQAQYNENKNREKSLRETGTKRGLQRYPNDPVKAKEEADRWVNGSVPSSDPEESSVLFFERYRTAYTHSNFQEDAKKRPLYVEAVHKIANFASKTFPIDRGEDLCQLILGVHKPLSRKKNEEKDFKPLPIPVIKSWIKSIAHVHDFDWPGKPIDFRLGRYIRLSRNYFEDYHPTQNYLLDILVKKGAIYGLEEFLFDIAKERELTKIDTKKLFESLQDVPIKFRESIEYLRNNVRIKQRRDIDDVLYNLLLIPQGSSSKSSLVALLHSLDEHYKDEELSSLILDSTPFLRDVMSNDNRVMQSGSKEFSSLTILSKIVGKPLLVPYLTMMGHVAKLKDTSLKDKAAYTNIAAEMLKDYYRKKEDSFSIEEVQAKVYRTIDDFRSLDNSSRKIGLKLMRRAIKQLDRSMRLSREFYPLPIDSLAQTVIKSLALDEEKTKIFFNTILGREEIEGENHE